jgi:hypothetical protein
MQASVGTGGPHAYLGVHVAYINSGILVAVLCMLADQVAAHASSDAALCCSHAYTAMTCAASGAVDAHCCMPAAAATRMEHWHKALDDAQTQLFPPVDVAGP